MRVKPDLLRDKRERLSAGLYQRIGDHTARIGNVERHNAGSATALASVTRVISSSGGGGTSDHSALSGLATDTHTQYVLAAGSRALTANWNAGAFSITANQFTAPAFTSGTTMTFTATTAASAFSFVYASAALVSISGTNALPALAIQKNHGDVADTHWLAGTSLSSTVSYSGAVGTVTKNVTNVRVAPLWDIDTGSTFNGEQKALQVGIATTGDTSGTVIANFTGLHCGYWEVFSAPAPTFTTARWIHIGNPIDATSAPTTPTITTMYGIDIDALTVGGTLNVGIRNSSTMRQVGALTVGSDAAAGASSILDVTHSVSSAGASAINGMRHTSTMTLTANTALNHAGALVDTSYNVETGDTASGLVSALHVRAQEHASSLGAINTLYALRTEFIIGAGGVVDATNIYIEAASGGVSGVWRGIDIPASALGATNIGIRNSNPMRQVGALTVGVDAAVTAGQIASITGNVGVTSGYVDVGAIGTPANPSAGSLRMFTRTSGNTISLVLRSATGDECTVCTLINVAHVNKLTLNWIE